jgi:hypothetical protein
VDALDKRIGGGLPVFHEWPDPVRVEHQADHVGGLAGAGIAKQPAEECLRCAVGLQHVPVAVHDDGWIRLESGQDPVERRAHRCGLLVGEPGLAIQRGIPGGQQKLIALPDRHVENAREPQHHLPARLRPSALDEAQVTGVFGLPDRFIGTALEIAGSELTNPAAAEVFSRVLGRKVGFRRLPMPVVRVALRREFYQMFRWFNAGGFQADVAGLRRD